MRLKFGLQTLLVLAAWFLSQSFNLPGNSGGKHSASVLGSVTVENEDQWTTVGERGKSSQSLSPDCCSFVSPPSIPELPWEHAGFLNGAYRIKTVVLDAGHGGKDPGCHGAFSEEKHSALAIILHLGDLIEHNFPNIKVIYTRDSDVFIELNERAAIANRNKADLFISVHCNAVPATASHINGTETYVMGLHTADHNLEVAKRENASIFYEKDYQKNYEGYDPNSPEAHIIGSVWQSAYLEQSILFASFVQKQAKTNAHREDKGVKQAGFLVLRETAMPAVLVESGYLTNRKEEGYIASAEGQQAMGEAIFDAFVAYKAKMEGSLPAKTERIAIRRPYIPELPSEPLAGAEETGGSLVVENIPVATVAKSDMTKGGPAPAAEIPKQQVALKNTTRTNVPPAGQKNPPAGPANNKQSTYEIFLLSWASRLDRNTGQLGLLSDVQERQENGEYRYYTGPFASKAEAEKMLPEIRNLGFRTAVIAPIK